MLFIASFFFLITGSQALQICGTAKGTIFLEPPELRDCSAAHEPHHLALKEQFQANMWVKRLKPIVVPSYVCYKETKIVRTTKTFFLTVIVDVIGVEHDDVDADVCNEMVAVAYRGAAQSAGKPWTLLKYDSKVQVCVLLFTLGCHNM